MKTSYYDQLILYQNSMKPYIHYGLPPMRLIVFATKLIYQCVQ
uniref:Uncharacterized protein n=1 Tax=Schistosoma japonicum TaxID=6182 RepID=Q5C1B8_SCHJA|nr:unknown [Schistosoma japonicum]